MASCRATSGLAHAGGPGKQIVADRLFRFAQARAGQLDGAAQRVDGHILAVNHTLQVALEIVERLLVVARNVLGRDARDLGDRVLDILDLDPGLALFLRQQHLCRANLVDHVDGLVGQLAVMNVAVRQFHRRGQRLVAVFDPMMFLVIGLQAAQDFNGVLDRRLVDVDLLETADQRPVFLEVVPELLVRGRADAAERTAGERRLQEI